MTRVLAGLLLVVMAAWCVACRRADDVGEGPENLLLITIDTVRADHLGCYGYGRDTSPNLDRFADGATVFLDATCSMPTTLPSHVSIFTGLPPTVHGVTRNGMVPARDLTTVFDLLAARGARTAAIVSAGVVQHRFLSGLGFEQVIFDRPSEDVFQIPADVVSDNAVRWLDRYGNEPFALWLHYFDPHEPYAPPPEFARRFADGYDGPLADELPTDWLVGLNDPRRDGELSDEDRKHIVNLYDAEIAFMDSHIGRVLDRLADTGMLEETMVVVVADHGQAHGENGFWGHGERLLEPVIKVSLMVRLPGFDTGRVVTAAVESLDVAPTVKEAFSLPEMPARPGRSLLAAMRGGDFGAKARRVVVRRSYTKTPERRGLAVHRVTSKGTYYRETDGESFHIGRIDGTGGLDGQNFFEHGSPESQWFEADVRRFLEMGQTTFGEVTDRDLEMLRALGYTQ